MLDSNALSQLKGLKQQLRDSRDIRSGIYHPARNRFGFVTDTDGNDIFLPPAEADKLLPGDEVEIAVTELDKHRIQGQVLKLLQSSFKHCHGYCIVKGNGFFVEVDDNSRLWLFVPPKLRQSAKDGDRVAASLLRHPFKNNGKGQLRIDAVIGNNRQPGIETAYAISKFGLCNTWPKNLDELVAELTETANTVAAARPLSTYPFVSIDAPSTRDIDDAIYCEARPDGWLVAIAIADPAAVISQHSPLDKTARARGATVYFPHGPLPMLPSALSAKALSLLPDQRRPALLCELHIAANGAINAASFSLQSIVSVARLNYFLVADYLNHGTITAELTDTIQHSLAAGKLASDALKAARVPDGLLSNNNRSDYRLRLNEAGKIEEISALDRTSAHELVEELMLAANVAAARFLADKQRPGPFSSHVGLRPERITESYTLLHELAPELNKNTNPATLEGFNAIKTAALSAPALVRPLRRLLSRTAIQCRPAPHFGLGFNCYTTISSPLRRYQDLLVHYQLHALINNEAAVAMHDDPLAALNEQLLQNRNAVRHSEMDLLAQYIPRLKDKPLTAEVIRLNHRQLTLRCQTNGIIGCLPTSVLGKQWKYDALRGKLTGADTTILLGDTFTVQLDSVDVNRRSVQFKLVQNVGTMS